MATVNHTDPTPAAGNGARPASETSRNPLYIAGDPHETAVNCAAVVAYLTLTDLPQGSDRAGNGHALILECVGEALEHIARDTSPAKRGKISRAVGDAA